MAIQFVPQTDAYRDAIGAFNRRVGPLAPFLLDADNDRTRGLIDYRSYLVVDGPEVRGGYKLAMFPALLNGAETTVANVQSPLSESIADKRYVFVPVQMLRQFTRHNARCFCVGMGRASNPLPRLLVAAGWTLEPVAFFFRIHRAARFLTELPALRSPAWKDIGSRAAARSGIGAAACFWLHRRRCELPAGIRLHREQGWGRWADSVWEAFGRNVRFAVRRDAAMLQELYPPGNPQLRVYRAVAGTETLGWSVALLTDMRANIHFGNLRVGSILDAAACPDGFFAVAALTDQALGAEGADLVITNQSLPRWQEAFRAAGFRTGPSNYLFACSPALAAALSRNPVKEGLVHIVRGDGDGRVNL